MLMHLKTPIIVGSYVNDVGSAVGLNSPLYNISSIGIEVVFQVDASDQETVSLGDSVEIELPTDEKSPNGYYFYRPGCNTNSSRRIYRSNFRSP